MVALINKIREFLDTKLSIWISMVVFFSVSLITFCIIIANQTYKNSRDNAKILGELQNLLNNQSKLESKHDEDVNDIYRYLSEIPAGNKTTTKLIIPPWQKNRDQQISDRLSQIQKSILELNGRVYLLENK